MTFSFLGRWRRVAILGAVLGGLVGFKAAEAQIRRYDFGINVTTSLPNWAFITDRHDRAVTRGDLVQFVPPPNEYYPAGQAFVKRVAGVAGDTVEIQGRDVFVAGSYIGRAKERSKDGKPAAIGPSGVIPKGMIFVAGEHVDSFDSRYAAIGWIPTRNIIGKAEPIL